MDGDKSKDEKNLWWRPAVEFFGQISGWIVFPIIVALFLGRYLDNKLDRAPMFLIICVISAFAITLFGLVKQTLKAAKKIEDQIKSDKSNK